MTIEQINEDLKDLKESLDFVPKEYKSAIEKKIVELDELKKELESKTKEVSEADKLIAQLNAKQESKKKAVKTAKTPAAKKKVEAEVKKVEVEKKKAVAHKTKVVKEVKDIQSDVADLLKKGGDAVAEFNKGRSAKEIMNDVERTALPAGKRISKVTGETYYEYRPDHADADPKVKLEKGGGIKKYAKGENDLGKSISKSVEGMKADGFTMSNAQDALFNSKRESSIKNQYEGKSAEQVWDEWTVEQRKHFLNDHSDIINRTYRVNHNGKEGYNLPHPYYSDKNYRDLHPAIKEVLEDHIEDGQYEQGGSLNNSYCVTYIDNNGKEQSTYIDAHTEHEARRLFKIQNEYREIISVEPEFEQGGNIAEGNKQMAINKAIEILHHAEELVEKTKLAEEIPAWVIALIERASTDLYDVTHYLDGVEEMEGEHEDGDYGMDGFGKGGSLNNLEKKVHNHEEFLIEIGKFEDKYRLVGNANYKENESPYSKGYAFEGDVIIITLKKHSEAGKSTYYTWSWKHYYEKGGALSEEDKNKKRESLIKKINSIIKNDNPDANPITLSNIYSIEKENGSKFFNIEYGDGDMAMINMFEIPSSTTNGLIELKKHLDSNGYEKGGRIQVNEKMRRVIIAIQRTRINPFDVSPAFVKEMAEEMQVVLTDSEINDISKGFGYEG